MRPLRQGCLLQPKPGRAREERKNVSFSFLLHNAVIDLMPIDTNAQSLGKRQIKPQNRHQSQIKPLRSTSSKTQITSKVLRWQEKVLKTHTHTHTQTNGQQTHWAYANYLSLWCHISTQNKPKLGSLLQLRTICSNHALKGVIWRQSKSHHALSSFSYYLHGAWNEIFSPLHWENILFKESYLISGTTREIRLNSQHCLLCAHSLLSTLHILYSWVITIILWCRHFLQHHVTQMKTKA